LPFGGFGGGLFPATLLLGSYSGLFPPVLFSLYIGLVDAFLLFDPPAIAFPAGLFPVELPPFAGGVNGRNPLFVPLEPPAVPFVLFIGVDGPRAACGDIAGAWYSPPADFAAIAEWPLKSPGLAVAAIAGLPWFTLAKFCLFCAASC